MTYIQLTQPIKENHEAVCIWKVTYFALDQHGLPYAKHTSLSGVTYYIIDTQVKSSEVKFTRQSDRHKDYKEKVNDLPAANESIRASLAVSPDKTESVRQ